MTGVAVQLRELRRTFGAVHALDNLDLAIEPGEFVALLGPSGCGKTTALRVLAGLEDADSGHVLVGGKDVTGLPANRRDMGMVFQAYSLFPHLTALANVSFGLSLRGRSRSAERAGEMLELVGISQFADRYPHQLSGGQQQRVALARALAIEPSVLLLDEPLSALDAKVRVQLRDEIRRIQTEVGTTTLFVTHDQEEALAVADRVGVMRAGKLEQLAAPADIYLTPASPFVAEFVGLSNRLPGVVTGNEVEVLGTRLPLLAPASGSTSASTSASGSAGPVTVLVRPESVRVTPDAEGDAAVLTTSFLGPISKVTVTVGEHLVVAQVATDRLPSLAPGTPVRVSLSPNPVALA
ncbi:ABC transporter ATP-binding protein [Paractinoplanes brasiliensis]|uniref:ABC-type quaternary amine transporter n=1 Tax=Paractinoplanes brasiliensis TaxID=52695 RepID=A0A4R6J919_9ACTN|nr:ABC transporter ATP-binding protein [Actinoplanes brasiliensis]TDO32110.1 putative spermidine/putrescine transport system ATP-binding protein [Actinoplanes brasiliensis]GID28160.1 ABC transporter ATP-binding protein [Actinoplanes brasiliensis]